MKAFSYASTTLLTLTVLLAGCATTSSPVAQQAGTKQASTQQTAAAPNKIVKIGMCPITEQVYSVDSNGVRTVM